MITALKYINRPLYFLICVQSLSLQRTQQINNVLFCTESSKYEWLEKPKTQDRAPLNSLCIHVFNRMSFDKAKKWKCQIDSLFQRTENTQYRVAGIMMVVSDTNTELAATAKPLRSGRTVGTQRDTESESLFYSKLFLNHNLSLTTK